MFPDKRLSGTQPNSTSDCRWLPPEERVIKINMDGAFIPDSGKAAVGVIARNDRSRPLGAF
jgi:hypothetical protein